MFALPDWHSMFSPALSIFEVFLRGSLFYLFIFALLRLVRRETGTISVADILVVVLIADAAQNGMAGEYTSIPEGIILVGTIVFWSIAVDWAGYNFEAIGRLVHPQPVELIKDGQPLRKNMRQNLITLDELMTSVRQAGTDDVGKVRRAWLEGNGEVSIVLAD
ncbi:MAG: DUF421 domain-containing protein [Dehalococcoidia bacterium]|nr:DUF421 domain-containing protein [Dehalococcoidia bacterium]